MLNLTFGEQVKIVLSRKGMTIKELAETIEERTGKAMSRQNLTQRLGRDNFQEQDMRMIADILGCPFQLSILSEIEPGDKNPAEEETAQRFIVAGAHHNEEGVQEEAAERDITIGELVDIHEELDALEAAKESEAAQEVPEEVQESEEAVTVGLAEEAAEEPTEELTAQEDADEEAAEEPETEPAAQAEEAVEVTKELAAKTEETAAEEEQPKKKAVTNVFKEYIKKPLLRGYNKAHAEEAHAQEAVTRAAEPEVQKVSEAPAEPKAQPEAKTENEVKGDINPYTGREYQTNSVRMHPKRIGYVQVYDRAEHKWTDMTEWAFLGYQERKKALLGKDYEPPIYLD